LRRILKRFFIGFEFGMVAAAVHGSVDCEDYVSHLLLLTRLMYLRL
jgi:hypothetical protein